MKLSKDLKRAIYFLIGFLYLSGTTEWALKNFFQVDKGMGPEPHPAEIWFLRLHGTISLAVLMLIGYVLRAHVLPSWKARRGIRSGLLLTTYVSVIILTVPGLMYLTDENLKSKVEILHAYLGLALIIPFVLHLFAKRRRDHLKKHGL
jgi:hypothetical protein